MDACITFMKTRAMDTLAAFYFILFLTTIQLSMGIQNLLDSCRESERLALLNFRKNLVDLGGRLSSWQGQDCCRWQGVLCDNITSHVTELHLRNPSHRDDGKSYFSGKLSPSLLELKHLHHLDVSGNNFAGAIPEFLGLLTNLRYLNLSNAEFSGAIPYQLGNLTRLQYLDIGSFYNTKPSHVADSYRWLSQLPSLRYLDMSSIDLSKFGIFDAICNLSSLSVLRLSNCHIQDIPTILPHVKLSSLSTIDLSGNYVYTMIPNWFFDITSLVTVDLSSNLLHGSISAGFRNMSSLEVLKLDHNIITGTIPLSIGSLCNLHTLDVSYNDITGDISMLVEGWAGCGRHDFIRRANPISTGRSSSLKYLKLSNNRFEGPVPELLGQLSELVILDLRGNSFGGVVSEKQFANTSKLQVLLLSWNPLVINISSDFTPPFQLEHIHLENTVTGPLFPAWLKNQRTFSTINLSNGSISDTMPDWFWGLSLRADMIVVSNNQISGRIPDSFRFPNAAVIDLRNNKFHGPLPHLDESVKHLDLSGNYFSGSLLPIVNTSFLTVTSILLSENRISGSIPPPICVMINLVILDLSSNLLSGEIPRCSEGLVKLSAMNLASNNLSGDIPHWLSSLVYLQTLHLNNNSFHGELPNLENCTNLRILDLGENKLSGNIPIWIGNRLSLLLILRLRSNSFYGDIPHQLSLLSELQVLDLAGNYLSGTLPHWLGSLSSMAKLENSRTKYHLFFGFGLILAFPYTSYSNAYEESLLVAIKGRELMYSRILFLVVSLDLSGNKFYGDIPEELMKLSELQNLNLSGNHLSGRIPVHIGRLRHLESLDLSSNQLSGEIPSSISSLAYISYLNLSYNNLSGKIPSGKQLQTLLDPSIYAGNHGLCGHPLPKKCQDGELYRASEFLSPILLEEKIWVFLSGIVGFAVGFWSFWATLLFKGSWRSSYFAFVDRMTSAQADYFFS